ncbi:MAG: hypothetical protein F6K26_50475 [Moorea sp. SIO2I5]|nr:hypothetical protein [Moorena sp. SIO2I5]
MECCEKNSRLYNALKSWIDQPSDWAHLSHLTTCLWMVVAVIKTGEVNLTRWIPEIPCRGQYARILQRRMQRWLHNARINIHGLLATLRERLYKPLIQAALADWKDDTIYLSLDTSLFWDQYCLVRLVVVHRGRALPVEGASARTSQCFCIQNTIIARCCNKPYTSCPKGLRSFYWQIDVIHTDLMKAMTTQWGWHYRIRLKKDSWIRRAGIGWCQLKDFHVLRGEALCFHNVKLHKEYAFWWGPSRLRS